MNWLLTRLMFLNESMAENSRREDRVQDDDPLNHIRRGFVFLIKTNIAKQPDTCFSLCYWYRPNEGHLIRRSRRWTDRLWHVVSENAYVTSSTERRKKERKKKIRKEHLFYRRFFFHNTNTQQQQHSTQTANKHTHHIDNQHNIKQYTTNTTNSIQV